jgi:hypothetical protein
LTQTLQLINSEVSNHEVQHVEKAVCFSLRPDAVLLFTFNWGTAGHRERAEQRSRVTTRRRSTAGLGFADEEEMKTGIC